MQLTGVRWLATKDEAAVLARFTSLAASHGQRIGTESGETFVVYAVNSLQPCSEPLDLHELAAFLSERDIA